MRFLHFLIGTVLFIGLIAAGGFIGNVALEVEMWNQWVVGPLAAYRLETLCAAAGTLILIVLFLLTGVRRHKAEPVVSFENEGGSVTVSIKALQDYLVKLGGEFAAVLDLRPRVRAGAGGAMDIELDIKVRSGTQLPELSRLLQTRVRESITGDLGLLEVKNVRVNVREIVVPPPEKARAQAHEDSVEWEGSMRP